MNIAITAGEPAGIGPDICIQQAAKLAEKAACIFIADANLLQTRSEELRTQLRITAIEPDDLQTSLPNAC